MSDFWDAHPDLKEEFDRQEREGEQSRRGGYSNGQANDPLTPLPYIIGASRAGMVRPERPWEVLHWVPRRQVTLLGGVGGIGKTLLALQLMVASASTGRWLGLPVRRCRAFGVFAEDEADEIDLRLRDLIDLADLDDLAWRSEIIDPCEMVDIGPDGQMRETQYFARLRL